MNTNSSGDYRRVREESAFLLFAPKFSITAA